MSDGVRIAVDVYKPREEGRESAFPVLFNYHPYSRAVIDPQTGQLSTTVGGSPSFISFFASHGYVIVIADMRGSGASYGSRADMSPQLGKDGKEIVDWIERQPWCSGNVGMYGGSYAAWSQFAVAAEGPGGLKCIMPEMGGFDGFAEGIAYSAGIYRRKMIEIWSGLMYYLDRAAYIANGPAGMPILPPAPVVDEDGDGEISDEIPLYPPGVPFFVFGPPAYRDGVKRDNVYYNAIKEHLLNEDIKEWAPAARFSDSLCGAGGHTWIDIGAGGSLERLREFAIPVYNVGGWFDLFSRGTAQWYCSLRATNPSRLLFLPLTHGSLDLFGVPMVGPYLRHFGEDPAMIAARLREERLRFFDRYLKGIDNGIEEDPPVLIYVMNGGGLRAEKEWPLARQVLTKYYLRGKGALSVEGPGEGADEYEADLAHDARQGVQNDSRWTGAWFGDDIIKRTEKRRKCITFTSPPLDDDQEVTGHPVIGLWVASTGRDADFFVYLEDINQEGEALYVTEGMARAGFCHRLLAENVSRVAPGLPCHGFRKGDYLADVFRDGKAVKLLFDLYPTSWVFAKGHRIGLSIASADWPSHDLNPALSPRNDPADQATTIPRITLFHYAECPSYLELPIIPRSQRSYGADSRKENNNG